MELYKNTLIEWPTETTTRHVERILWIKPDGTGMFTIDIFDPKAREIYRHTSDINADLETKAACILEDDPYASLIRPEEEIDPKHRQLRDKYWELIRPLVEDAGPELFIRHQRNSPIAQFIRERGLRKTTVYKGLRRFRQRGQTKNAFLPMFAWCGWKGPDKDKDGLHQVRTTRAGTVSTAKLGTTTRTKIEGKSSGMNVDEDVLSCFRAGRDLFYETRKGVTQKMAFQKILERFFSNRKGGSTRDGQRKAVVKPASQRPTLRQFQYWLAKDHSPSRETIGREGQHKFDLTGRAITGDSTHMAIGPGSLFQIDSTIGDCYLVSSLDRNRIIGRPVIHFVVDVFSHLVVGFNVGLEHGWVGAMLALYNACANKVQFCAEYGITIDESDWPSCHFPEGILADRGELEGYSADHLVNAFGVRVQNTSPGRADLKGIVERYIGCATGLVIKWLPGAVRKRERGDKDYRLDAVLDLNDFRKLILIGILHHNKHQRIENYRLDEDMIVDRVEPTRLNLWSWGIKNRSGHLRKVPENLLRLNLLPEVEASVRPNGIYCKGIYYTCDLAIKEEWLERAKQGTWKVRLARDPRNISKAYLRLDDGRSMEVCRLVEADVTFADRDWYEMTEEFEIRKQLADAARDSEIEGKCDFNAYTESVVQSASDKTTEQKVHMSNLARVSGIRENQQEEKELEREADSWDLEEEEAAESRIQRATRRREAKDEAPPGYVPPAQPMDKLRQAREGRI